MAETTLIRNASAIVSCDANDSIHYEADMLISGPEILSIGKNLQGNADTIIDGRGKFVYPGLVNTHHHFFQTFFRNLAAIDYPNMSVLDWIGEIYQLFKYVDEQVIYYSSLVAMADLLKHGATTVFDHQYCYPRAAGKNLVDRQMQAAAQLGLRYHAGRGANTLPASAGGNVPDEMVESTDEFIRDCERLIDKYHDPRPFSTRQIVIAPCQPINCRKETFIESIRLAREKGVYLHTHLGEGENEPMLGRWGKRTLAWCEEIGFTGEDVWVAHGWELTPEEYERHGANENRAEPLPRSGSAGRIPDHRHSKDEKGGNAIEPGMRRVGHQRRIEFAGFTAHGVPAASQSQQELGRLAFSLRDAENRHGRRRGHAGQKRPGEVGTPESRGPIHDRCRESGIFRGAARSGQPDRQSGCDGAGLADDGERGGALP